MRSQLCPWAVACRRLCGIRPAAAADLDCLTEGQARDATRQGDVRRSPTEARSVALAFNYSKQNNDSWKSGTIFFNLFHFFLFYTWKVYVCASLSSRGLMCLHYHLPRDWGRGEWRRRGGGTLSRQHSNNHSMDRKRHLEEKWKNDYL